jgi:hypothetical protein
MTRKFVLAGAAVAVVFSLSAPAIAGANDYVFEPVTAEMKKGDDVIVSVRLKNKATGKLVTDAVIIQSRIDMSPDGMGEMASQITPMPSNERCSPRYRSRVAALAQPGCPREPHPRGARQGHESARAGTGTPRTRPVSHRCRDRRPALPPPRPIVPFSTTATPAALRGDCHKV